MTHCHTTNPCSNHCGGTKLNEIATVPKESISLWFKLSKQKYWLENLLRALFHCVSLLWFRWTFLRSAKGHTDTVAWCTEVRCFIECKEECVSRKKPWLSSTGLALRRFFPTWLPQTRSVGYITKRHPVSVLGFVSGVDMEGRQGPWSKKNNITFGFYCKVH